MACSLTSSHLVPSLPPSLVNAGEMSVLLRRVSALQIDRVTDSVRSSVSELKPTQGLDFAPSHVLRVEPLCTCIHLVRGTEMGIGETATRRRQGKLVPCHVRRGISELSSLSRLPRDLLVRPAIRLGKFSRDACRINKRVRGCHADVARWFYDSLVWFRFGTRIFFEKKVL